jgi:hypothetical protein
MSSTTQTPSKRESKPVSKGEQDPWQPLDDLVASLRNYVREEPDVAACICLGVGFILGWKLKPW